VRSFLRALVGRGLEIGLTDFRDWSGWRLAPEQLEPWLVALEREIDAPAMVQFCMSWQVMDAPGRLNVNFTMFEANRIPNAWRDANLGHDLVVVPTESSRQAWITSGFPAGRVEVCPLGVDTERFRPGLEPLPLGEVRGRLVRDHRLRFLNVSEAKPRKNLMSLLQVWLEATRPDDDAVLIIKLTHSDESGLRFLRDLHGLEHRLGRTRDQAASLVLLDPVLSDAEVPRFYAAATHYWSMSHGEGWDQPMTEAAATGLRLIAPDHSAYRAYLDDRVATMLPSAPAPAHYLDRENLDPRVFEPMFSGEPLWWQPDQDAAAAALRAAIAGRDVPVEDPRVRMARFTWDEAARRLVEIVEGALAAQGAR
jgi:glycosyltransferase involved in cell wall biosynthesis